jgi:hypothetical protein
MQVSGKAFSKNVTKPFAFKILHRLEPPLKMERRSLQILSDLPAALVEVTHPVPNGTRRETESAKSGGFVPLLFSFSVFTFYPKQFE